MGNRSSKVKHHSNQGSRPANPRTQYSQIPQQYDPYQAYQRAPDKSDPREDLPPSSWGRKAVGKRRRRPEYILQLRCKHCKREGYLCRGIGGMNMRNVKAYRNPTYEGGWPDDWVLELDFCSWGATADRRARSGDGRMNAEELIRKYTGDLTCGDYEKNTKELQPWLVDDLLRDLKKEGVEYKSIPEFQVETECRGGLRKPSSSTRHQVA